MRSTSMHTEASKLRAPLECRIIKGLHQLFSMQRKSPDERLRQYLERVFPSGKGRWIAMAAYAKLKDSGVRPNIRDLVEAFVETVISQNSRYLAKYAKKQQLRKLISSMEQARNQHHKNA